VHKDHPEIKKLDDIILLQEDNIRELEMEIIEVSKLVEEKRIFEALYEWPLPQQETHHHPHHQPR